MGIDHSSRSGAGGGLKNPEKKQNLGLRPLFPPPPRCSLFSFFLFLSAFICIFALWMGVGFMNRSLKESKHLSIRKGLKRALAASGDG